MITAADIVLHGLLKLIMMKALPSMMPVTSALLAMAKAFRF